MEATGRERQNNVRYHREGDTQIVSIPLHGAHFTQNVTDIDHQTVRLEWTAEADETLDEGAYFCRSFSGDNYSDALFSIKGQEGRNFSRYEDWSYIPGGVISGTALIRPDFPELLVWPYLWQQTEYVLGGGSSHYMFLVLAVRHLL